MSELRRGILFLCVANSARSQMAESLARAVAPAGVAIYSAGSEPGVLNPRAVQAMLEIGIDISLHRSKAVHEIPAEQVDTVVTLCAAEVCPVFLGDVERLHWPLEDPASVLGSEAEMQGAFRRVRDELRGLIKTLFGSRGRIPAPQGANADLPRD